MLKKIKWKRVIMYFLLILLVIICFFPFYVMIINATRSNTDIVKGFGIVPGRFLIENYKSMVNKYDVIGSFCNSVFVSVCATGLSLYFSAFTAFGFFNYQFKGKNVLFIVLLATMMIPSQVSIIGFYELNRRLKLLNSFIPLIIPGIASAGSVFFIRQYTESALSASLLEAARIDGCGEFKIFHKIALPIMMPSIATMGIFSFVGNWNNYITPLILLNKPEKFTLPLAIASLAGTTYKPDLGAQYLAVCISIVPIMVAFFCCSNFIIGGLSTGAVKE